MTVVWDQWEDGYELNALNPLQTTTKVWGDGNPYNGIAPGYSNDIIPAGGSILLDNTMPANPRVATSLFYDGKDKITSSGQIAITQVCGEPTNMPVQAIKTNVTSTFDFGKSFTVPLGENFNSQDFLYTALFVRAENDNTVVQLDKDNDGTLETSFTLNQGQSYLVNGGVKYGATVTSNNPVGVELNSGGVDGWSIRNASIFPASWYSNVYYTPVSTSDNSGDSPKDSSVVMLYNSLNRSININWTSGIPSNGTITIPAKSVVRFPLAYSNTAAYKFVNPTGEAFTAIEIVDSYTPGGGGNDGLTYDWSFNLISEARLTDFATTAWAPGGLDLVAPAGPDVNGNPIWVTPNMNTTIYVKWDGKVSGTAGSLSPCGLRYDVSYNVNALNYIKLRDLSDNDQSGIAIFTCNGAKIAAVYGEDPQGSGTGVGVAYWDVGTTILPFCKQKLILANDDYARTIVSQPVTIPILLNDFGFLAVVDPTTVSTAGMLPPSHGTVSVNTNGTLLYTPAPGYIGKDTLEYNVCSTGSPIVCDRAFVYIDISTCPAPYTQNLLSGKVFLDKNDDGINNDGGTGVPGAKVYLYIDGNCNGIANTNELKDSVTVDASGTYQFITYPEKFVEDDFDGIAGARTCADGSDGDAAWSSNWTDIGDPSTGFCNTTQSITNTDAEIVKDGAFTNAIRLKDNNVSVTRTVNLTGASYAFLSFSYRRKTNTLTAGKDIIVQASSNGTTFGTVFTIAGDGNADANYVNIYNQDITAFAAGTTYIRFLTNNNVADADTVYIDNVKVQYISYPICYITKLNVATIPANYHTTTILQHALTATSTQTCLAPYDFGIAKNKIAVSGTLFRDANGITDNKVNGTSMGRVDGNNMYAYLTDTTGLVAYKTTVNVTTGNYIFSAADVLTNYTLQVSAMSVNVGEAPPTDAGLSTLTAPWEHTGESFGKNNLAGIGIKSGVANGTIFVNTGSTNVDSVNVAIETLPDSDNRNIYYTTNTVGIQYPITGGLTGIDDEDGILGANKTYKITELPIGSVLYYNNVEVLLNQVITSFNPALLTIDPDDNRYNASFMYASRDAAGLYDPTPALIVVNWTSVLPVKLISFGGRLEGSQVNLNWVTESEVNTKHFEIERSENGNNFIKIGTVTAKGSTNTIAYYNLIDFTALDVNYYRLKIVNNDGSFEYSKIVVIRLGNNLQAITKVSPNPFVSKLDVALTLAHNTNVEIRIMDVSGKVVFTKTMKGMKGSNVFTLNDLEKLQASMYMLHIKTDDAQLTEKLIKR
jgi:Secretion system C-terminal sorting domain/Bacterial Ig domain